MKRILAAAGLLVAILIIAVACAHTEPPTVSHLTGTLAPIPPASSVAPSPSSATPTPTTSPARATVSAVPIPRARTTRSQVDVPAAKRVIEAPSSTRKSATSSKKASSVGGFANCDAARAAGAAPLSRGQAGYSSKLDRDGDGVACE